MHTLLNHSFLTITDRAIGVVYRFPSINVYAVNQLGGALADIGDNNNLDKYILLMNRYPKKIRQIRNKMNKPNN